ncbi:hypothetical protein F441_04237 [Phytophthora nicotianae CJ01A1]|uniref:Uncharacterized protein n=5 Tax=Phytophthora nicotianae TaxID=4792 RepID=W2QMJ7_PHYN3|nr:hypothetical protein PPTG_22366 [Phytophthora nicotianae INRA-310]ETK92419.1 hypothetical protein L915_04147 [Phytophthora nicotianae]ETO81320.1 hypothetical protein F444_04345 [Phytophthora nicotianae P1976]ETP22385.1 hypothetical protein F441_04237 [Phytophthora nicotianae CJ01A1]ETP50267.1 hypothetical protein F442_04258 [Phytophthora nicotianae P10297]ETL45814.1 hypothetical protein L916_04102 [Phytophthora nicotianae]
MLVNEGISDQAATMRMKAVLSASAQNVASGNREQE